MSVSGFRRTKVRLWAGLSTAFAAFAVFVSAAAAHEVMPAIADLEQDGITLRFTVAASIETYIAGVNLEGLEDTNGAVNTDAADVLRALEPEALADQFRAYWPQMAAKITVQSGEKRLPLTLTAVEVFDAPDLEVARQSIFRFDAALPDGADAVIVGWTADLGALVLRQQGVADPYDGYLDGGALSPPIALTGGTTAGGWQTYAAYVPTGVAQIVPLGPQHVLFALGLFFLSVQLAPLAWQMGAFALGLVPALTAATLGGVSLSASLTAPFIAVSVIVLALDTLLSRGPLRPWRLPLVAGFGLVHGLALAGDLAATEPPASGLIPALIGFAAGALLGLVSVLAVAYLLTFMSARTHRAGTHARLAGIAGLGLALALAGLAATPNDPPAVSRGSRDPSGPVRDRSTGPR